jgi:signal transduction histidine kinase/CheY-like chemotaxis protein
LAIIRQVTQDWFNCLLKGLFRTPKQQVFSKPAILLIASLVTCIVWLGIPSLGCAQAGEIDSNRSNPLQKVSLQLKWRHQFQFAGYYAAIEKGYYRELGLEVELREAQKSLDITDEVVSRRADYGVLGNRILLKRLQGQPVKVLAALFQYSPLVILAPKRSGISTPQDLVDKRLMYNLTSEITIPVMLDYEGVSLNQLEILNNTHRIEDLLLGKADAMSVYATNQPFLLRQQGIPYNLIYPHKYGAHAYGDCLFTSEEEAARNPERVKAFLAASLKGWQYALAHPEEIIQHIHEKYGSRRSIAHLRYEAKTMRKFILPDLVQIGHMNPGRWHSMAQTLAALGLIEQDYSLDGFMYGPDKIQDYAWLRPLIFVLTGLVLIFLTGGLILLLFNRRLQNAVIQKTRDLTQINVNLRREIAERKETQKQLLEAMDAAQQANQAKSTFLARMSHEIRTPMNAIMGMTELTLDSKLTSAQRENLNSVNSAAEHLLDVINDILDISKIEAGKFSLEQREFDLASNIRQLVKCLKPRANEKGLGLNLEISGQIPAGLIGDIGRLRQVLYNLVSNSIKFTTSGQVTLRIELAPLLGNKVHISFEVADTGIGIPPKQLKNIFNAFTQADVSTTRKYGGTGLGLTISQQLVEMMGGNLGVHSRVGRGSRFYFQLEYAFNPAWDQVAQAEVSPGTAAPRRQVPPGELATQDIRVLLVEDNQLNQRVAQAFLEKIGVQVFVATDGSQAVEQYTNQPFDLILMDVEMPVMDGMEATRLIRLREAEWGAGHVPIVAMTAHAMAGDEERCRQAGMDGYMAKPIDAQVLYSTLEKVLELEERKSPLKIVAIK